MRSNALETLKSLSKIPNAPFSVKNRSEYLKKLVEETDLEYEENDYYFKVKLNSLDETCSRIIFTSHLDHPGFVFKNRKVAKAFGSLYLHKVKKFNPISVFNPAGDYLGDVKLVRAYGKDESWIEVDSEFDIPINSQGLWNVGDLITEGEKVKTRSHDNDIATSILLSNLKPSMNSNYEVVYIFTKHEEVLQQSAYHLAKYNLLGINSRDIVINMEAMKVYSIVNNPRYSNLTYTDGPVLNISEASGLYSQGSRNLGESLINNISVAQNLRLQRGLAGGSSDARVFSLFNLTPNIVTLNIPNRYKHNVNGEAICYEEVRTSDIDTVNSIVKHILEGNVVSLEQSPLDISNRVGEEIVGSNFNRYSALNDRLEIANRSVIKRGYYFPQSIFDVISDMYFKAISYVIGFLSNRGIGGNVSKD